MSLRNLEFTGPLSFDDVMIAGVKEYTPNAIKIKNLATGYSVLLESEAGDFVETNGVPTAGTINRISLVAPDDAEVYSVDGLNGPLAAFWSTYSGSGFSRVGSAAAVANLLAIVNTDSIQGGDGHDRIGVYGAPKSVLGYAGNDTFLVHAGVNGTEIYGSVLDGFGHDTQNDIVEIYGSATLAGLHSIDQIRFMNDVPSATLSLSGNGIFDVKAIQGSATGADTIKFTGGAEWVNLDISHLQFSNWGRANQQILVDLNTGTTKPLDDRFVGSMASERVTAGNGRDLLYGNAGNDYLDGGDDIDVIDGGEGNDTLIGGGGEGPNILKGGNGNDVYKFNEKVDIVIDTGGLDSRMVSKNSTLSAKDKFEGLAADGALSAGKTVNLTGNAKANVLVGHIGKNTLKGINGNDIIEGRGGNDQLDGGAGNDQLYGGLGNDKLTGAAGKDTFYFDTALSGTNVDRILSFSTKDDRIALHRDIFTALSGSKLASSAFYIGSKAMDSGDQIIYNKSTGALSYDADGTGTAAGAIKFATLDKNLKLSASDFILV